MEEIWKDVIGYENKYEVSNLGRVRSCPRNTSGLGRADYLIMKQSKDRGGYMIIGLMLNGKKSRFRVHRLVASAFIPNPENKEFVNHIDGVKDNNILSNLEWSTPSENTQHAVKAGLINSNFDKYKHNFVDDYLNGLGINMITRKYNVSHDYVSAYLKEQGVKVYSYPLKHKKYRARINELFEDGYKPKQVEEILDYKVPYNFIRSARQQYLEGKFIIE